LPKSKFVALSSASAECAEGTSESDDDLPPILGDQERNFACQIVMISIFIENSKFASSLVEIMYTPSSRAWILGGSISCVIEVMKRTGWWQQMSVVVLGLCGRAEWARMTSVKVLYVRAHATCGYVTVFMAIFIGCVRAASFGDVRCIIWLDVNTTIPIMLLIQLLVEIGQDIVVKAVHALGWAHLPLSANYPPHHPFSIVNFRPFSLSGYAAVFSIGCV
jgi:hypothetical protein